MLLFFNAVAASAVWWCLVHRQGLPKMEALIEAGAIVLFDLGLAHMCAGHGRLRGAGHCGCQRSKTTAEAWNRFILKAVLFVFARVPGLNFSRRSAAMPAGAPSLRAFCKERFLVATHLKERRPGRVNKGFSALRRLLVWQVVGLRYCSVRAKTKLGSIQETCSWEAARQPEKVKFAALQKSRLARIAFEGCRGFAL